ncbi:PAXNEB-domain-containing protein [Dentipellis sp. KUC8613]|nr:PAXNEB-domain-containing protein [Dentipellis sp. KUC8613]
MSSFKRKAAAKHTHLPTGTRFSPASPSTTITSTGIPSLDDILGGGLPLSCSLLVLAPDPHSAYGELVQKYFIAQGLACGQRVCVVDDDAEEFVSECMWMSGLSAPPTPDSEEAQETTSDADGAAVKIAWRYEQMKQFQTTVSSSNQLTDEFCRTFDLTCKLSPDVLKRKTDSADLGFVTVSGTAKPMFSVINEIAMILEESSGQPIRICIPAMGSPQWGDLETQDLLRFLHQLRSMLRRHPHACAAMALPAFMSSDGWGGPGWTEKLSWLVDASITLAAFTADPSLSALFPSHHGLLNIHTLPSPHTILSPSDRFSILRGISSNSSSAGGGENNLAFKCMRKRLVFETLHLDVEGGVGERRTTPATNAVTSETVGAHTGPSAEPEIGKSAAASLQIQFEETQKGAALIPLDVAVTETKPAKAKKRVAFQSDRPDLYDF